VRTERREVYTAINTLGKERDGFSDVCWHVEGVSTHEKAKEQCVRRADYMVF